MTQLTVCICAYNAEKYIAETLESLSKQTFKDFELFLVDDGSKDRSGEICDEYAKNDNRIKVIHKENGGAPSARNVAIDQAEGKYMFFMDPDDWAEPFMLEDLVRTAEEDNAQMVVCGFFIDFRLEAVPAFAPSDAKEITVSKLDQGRREALNRAGILVADVAQIGEIKEEDGV